VTARPHLDRLSRFNVAHARCGEVVFSEPTEVDLDADSLAVSARCNGCGRTCREHVPWTEFFNEEFYALLNAAGVSFDELRIVSERDDPEEYAALVKRVLESPALLHAALRDIRQQDETQN
jgi:predicted Fe-S protein YdhL (DUF1289 family)